MFQNVLMDPMISKEKQISSFFQCLLESLCPFQKKNWNCFCVFSMSNTCLHVFHTNVNMCYFILNMLKLFQKII